MEAVTIRTFDNYIKANMMLAQMEQAGIKCYLKDDFTVTIDPILSNAIGGIKLQVEKSDLEGALQLLKDFDEEYMKAVKCPACGSASLVLINKPGPINFFTAVLTWTFSNYALPAEQVYQCQNCKREYKTLPE